ncbi:MAG: hypothetical protein AAF628_19445 [Planctomycetota bacterium]
MSLSIRWSLDIEATEGPSLGISRVQGVEAVIHIEVPVPETDTAVEVTTGSGDDVTFLALLASDYSGDIAYTLDKGDATSWKVLDHPLVLTGAAAVGLLGKPSPIFVKNSGAAPLSVSVLLGGDATP